MNIITREECISKLYKLEKINVKITGYIKANINFEKYNIFVDGDEVKIEDDKNMIILNFNSLRNIQSDESKIVINLDDEIDTIIEIKI